MDGGELCSLGTDLYKVILYLIEVRAPAKNKFEFLMCFVKIYFYRFLIMARKFIKKRGGFKKKHGFGRKMNLMSKFKKAFPKQNVIEFMSVFECEGIPGVIDTVLTFDVLLNIILPGQNINQNANVGY